MLTCLIERVFIGGNLFVEKNVPKHLENQMELKFLELKQENMLVAEHGSKFIVSHRVNTDEKQYRSFIPA